VESSYLSEGLLICHDTTQAIVGGVNLSQIFYGAFQNAYMGYYAMWTCR
jgi:ribosomal-protein-alanine N-acetyltransferase